MTVRTENRRGLRRLVIDITYRNQDGQHTRFRQDAQVQTVPGARAEDARRTMLLAVTGAPFERPMPPIEDDEPPSTRPKREKPVELETTITFSEAADRFLALYAETRLKPSTRRGYRSVLETLLVPRLGKRDLLEIDATMVRELDRDLLKKKAQPSTRRNVQCVLRSVLRFAIEQGLADELPKMPPLPRVGATVTMAMSDEEVDRVLDEVPDAYQLAFGLSRYAGLRAGEVRGLRWGDVDLAKNVIVVRRARCCGVEAPPKSGHERLIPIHPTLREMLEAETVESSKHYVTGPSPETPWTEFALGHAFSRACKKTKVEGFRLHDLRHWFVTTLFRVGNSAPVVQRLAGHAHLITTQRYAHATLEDLETGIRRMHAGNGAVADPTENHEDPGKTGNAMATERARKTEKSPKSSMIMATGRKHENRWPVPEVPKTHDPS